MHYSGSQLRIKLVMAAVLVAVSVAVYSNTLYGEFVSDDNWQVLQNAWITDFAKIGAVFTGSVWSFAAEVGESNYYRPIMYIFYMISYKISGLESSGFHAVNIALHALNSVGVFMVITELLKRDRATDCDDSGRIAPSIAFLSALVFATHPVNTEVVAWVASIPELSFTLFVLIGIYLHMRGKTIVAGVFFLMALLSKETGLALLPVAIVFDLKVERIAPGDIRRWAKRYWPYLTAWIIYLALRLNALGGMAPAPEGEKAFTPLAAALNLAPLMAEYLEKLVWPTGLTFYDYLRFDPITGFGDWRVYFYLACGVAVIFLIKRLWKRAPLTLFSISWIIVPLLPALYSGWTKGGPAFAERYLYMSTAGVSFILAIIAIGLVHHYSKTGLKAKAALIITLFFISVTIVFSVATIKRNTAWQSAYSLWKDTVEKSPANIDARLNYGTELARKGLLDEALKEYEVVLKLDPKNDAGHNNMGILYARKGFYRLAAGEFRLALELDPTNAEAGRNLEQALKLIDTAAPTR